MNNLLGHFKNSPTLKIAFSILIAAGLFMGFKNVTNKGEINEIFLSLEKSPWYLVLIIALLFLNIYAESQKWKGLISEKIPSISAVKAVLVGYSTALITPNRIGEFAGRNVLFSKEKTPTLTTATLLGSFIQGSITVCFGVISLVLFPYGAQLINYLDYELLLWTVSLAVLIFTGLYLFREKISSHLQAYIAAFKNVTSTQILYSTVWGGIRYTTFLLQFYLALLLFGFEGSFLLAACGISVMYLIQSYIPLTSLGELGVREFLSFLIFSPYMEISIAAVFPALIIWLVNILIPSLTGFLLFQNQLRFAK